MYTQIKRDRRTTQEMQLVEKEIIRLYNEWPEVYKTNHIGVVTKALEILPESKRYKPEQLAHQARFCRKNILTKFNEILNKFNDNLNKPHSLNTKLEQVILDAFKIGIPIVLKEYIIEVLSPLKEEINKLIIQHRVVSKPVIKEDHIPVGNPANIREVRTPIEEVNENTPILKDDVGVGIYGLNLNQVQDFKNALARRKILGLVPRFYSSTAPCAGLYHIFVYGSNYVEEDLLKSLNSAGYYYINVTAIPKCHGSWERLIKEVIDVYHLEMQRRDA